MLDYGQLLGGLIVGGAITYVTKGGAAWKLSAQGNERLVQTRDAELKDSRAEVTALRAENKEFAAKISALETEVATLKTAPNYAGIQSHLDAIETRNIDRDKGITDQLTAQTALLTQLIESQARASGSMRTRKTDAVKA